MCSLSPLTDKGKNMAEESFQTKETPSFSSLFENLVACKAELEPVMGKQSQNSYEALRLHSNVGIFRSAFKVQPGLGHGIQKGL